MKYLRTETFGSKDIVIRKSEFVAKTQFLSLKTSGVFFVFEDIRNYILCGFEYFDSWIVGFRTQDFSLLQPGGRAGKYLLSQGFNLNR